MFSCDNISSSNGNGYGSYYLRRDYTIECSGSKFYFGVVWACIMIIVYPIGLPLLNFWLLYKRRHQIQNRFHPENNNDYGDGDGDSGELDYYSAVSNLRILSGDTRIIEFLYRSYIPRLWYFECVETLRRLFLTAFISVIAPGSSTQLLVAICTALFFLLMYIQVKPYLEYGTSMLSQYGLVLIFVSYIGATFVGEGLFSDYAASVITSLLIVGTVCLIALALFHELNNYRGFLAFRRMLEKDGETHMHIEDILRQTGDLYTHAACVHTQIRIAFLSLSHIHTYMYISYFLTL